jgi:hypothetical protein
MKRTKTTSQPKKEAKKKQVKTTAAQKKSKKQVKTTVTQKKSKRKASSAPPSILAVAIGDPNNSRTIDSIFGLSYPNPCRPYVAGMVDQLMKQSTPRILGVDYVIDYQECFEGSEAFTANPALILCMSTPVMKAAVAFTNQVPIVGVTSNPGDFPGNVCGVNAQRTNNPYATYYVHFKNKLSGGQTITLLNRTQNLVSEACKNGILQHVDVPVAEVDFPTGDDPTQPIVNAINTVPVNSGLLVLPVDVFFGFYDTINTTAASRNLTVFWPAEEFAHHGQPHFGSSQVACGQIFGDQVAYILSNKTVPTGGAQWKKVNPR